MIILNREVLIMNELTVFAKNMEAQRKRLKLYQKDIAEKTGLTKAAISSYEKGAKLPNLENAVKIANALDTTVDELCGMKSSVATMSTYSDLLEVLMNIVDMTNADVSAFCEKKVKYCNDDDQLTLTTHLCALKIENETLYHLVKDWEKILKLYREKTIDEELYEAWKMKKKQDYHRYTLYDKDGRFCDPDADVLPYADDLPF